MASLLPPAGNTRHILFRARLPTWTQVRSALDEQRKLQLFRQPAPVGSLARTRRPVKAESSGFCLFQSCSNAFYVGVGVDECRVVGLRQPVRVVALYALVPLRFEGVVDDQFKRRSPACLRQFILDRIDDGTGPGHDRRRQGIHGRDALDVLFAEQVRTACTDNFLPLFFWRPGSLDDHTKRL